MVGLPSSLRVAFVIVSVLVLVLFVFFLVWLFSQEDTGRQPIRRAIAGHVSQAMLTHYSVRALQLTIAIAMIAVAEHSVSPLRKGAGFGATFLLAVYGVLQRRISSSGRVALIHFSTSARRLVESLSISSASLSEMAPATS